MNKYVLDASALLAALDREVDAEEVEPIIKPLLFLQLIMQKWGQY